MKHPNPTPSEGGRISSPRTLLVVAFITGTALLTMGAGCPKKLPYGADQSLGGLVYEEVKEEYDRKDKISKLEKKNEALQSEIDLIENDLAQIETDLDNIRFKQGMKGIFIKTGTADAGDYLSAGALQLQKGQLKQRRQDLTNKLNGLRRQQRQNSAQISKLQRGGSPSNAGQNAARNTAQQTTRRRTPTGSMPTGAHAHAPAPPRPPAHAHH